MRSPPSSEDLCAVEILGGEKRDDLLKDDVREIGDAVHRRFYRFLISRWGGLAASPRATGVGSTTGIAAGESLIFLALGPADSIFLVGIAPSSRV